MKDLYQRIRVPPRVDDPEIILRGIKATAPRDPRSANGASRVLLVPNRKRVYDRTHAVVHQIGRLRAEMGLLRAPNWLGADCADFDGPPSSPSAEKVKPSEAATSSVAGDERTQRLALGAVALGVVTLVSAIYVETNGGGLGRTSSFWNAPPSRVAAPASQPSSRVVAADSKVDQRRQRLIRFVKSRYGRAGLPIGDELATVKASLLLGEQAEERPPTGELERSPWSKPFVVPLEVKTREGCDYFIKVIDSASRTKVLTAYCRGGDVLNTSLPVGTYEFRFASGQRWFGPVLDFGERAVYSLCDERFNFVETSTGYSGFTLELYPQQNGNLKTETISEDAF